MFRLCSNICTYTFLSVQAYHEEFQCGGGYNNCFVLLGLVVLLGRIGKSQRQLLLLRVAMLGSLLSNDLNHASTNRWWPGCHGVFSLRPLCCWPRKEYWPWHASFSADEVARAITSTLLSTPTPGSTEARNTWNLSCSPFTPPLYTLHYLYPYRPLCCDAALKDMVTSYSNSFLTPSMLFQNKPTFS